MKSSFVSKLYAAASPKLTESPAPSNETAELTGKVTVTAAVSAVLASMPSNVVKATVSLPFPASAV